MLSLTDDAATTIRALLDRPGVPDGSGLRLAVAGDGSEGYQITAATGPAAGDAVVDVDGARVFVEPVAADALTDKVLDANTDDEGLIRFSFIAP